MTMEKLKKGDKVEWLLSSGSLWLKNKPYRALSDEEGDETFAVESEKGPEFRVSSAPSLWRRLPRESAAPACAHVTVTDGCAGCAASPRATTLGELREAPKPALPRRAHSVADLKPGMRVEFKHRNGSVWPYTLAARGDGAVAYSHPDGDAVTSSVFDGTYEVSIIAEPAAVEVPKVEARTSGWASHGPGVGKRIESITIGDWQVRGIDWGYEVPAHALMKPAEAAKPKAHDFS